MFLDHPQSHIGGSKKHGKFCVWPVFEICEFFTFVIYVWNCQCSNKDQDQDKDLWIKDQDKNKDFKKFTVKDKDKDFGLKDKDFGQKWSQGHSKDFKGRLNSKNLHDYI